MKTNEQDGATTTITITQEELELLNRAKLEKLAKEQKERQQRERESYRELVDDVINVSIPELLGVSQALKDQKDEVYKRFATVIEMKDELFGLKDGGQRSHTFTNSSSTARIKIGAHALDNYDDTAESGIEMVREYIASLAGDDDKTRSLVDIVLRLLQRDNKSGQLKASRVLQLDRIATESGNERFMQGVTLIKEAYRPIDSKRYVQAEIKDEKGAWVTIPLGMTEA